MKKQILIADRSHKLFSEGLKMADFLVDYCSTITLSEVLERVDWHDGLIINSKINCDAHFMDQAAHLQFIGRLGSGLDIVDLELAENLGIQVFSSP